VGDAAFFRALDSLMPLSAAKAAGGRWRQGGVAWHRERHGYTGPEYGFSVEVTTGEKPDAPAWTLVLVKEYWWNVATGAAIKTTQWAHVRKGRRADVIAWLRREQHGPV
jgi:hypothetical protein